MYTRVSALTFVVLSLFSLPRSEAQASSPFQDKVRSAITGGTNFKRIELSGTAEWTAGTLKENGSARLNASIDGTTTLQFTLDKLTRTESYSASELSRSCQLTDSSGTAHEIQGSTCFVAVPWFFPRLFAQDSSRLPSVH